MSEVDERVVQMKFDNAQFEAGVQQTLQSLNKLNDSIEKNTYPIYDPDENNILEDELEWRKMFSNRLCAKMHKFGYNQSLLSEATGISQVTISKYINCKATPTAYNVQKLAKALHCNSFELTEYRVF